MIDARCIKESMNAISTKMEQNCSFLCEIDAKTGDGDLGLSMRDGFAACCNALEGIDDHTDIGTCFFTMAKSFNRAAPSSLGTILSIFFMGMARPLKNIDSASLKELSASMLQGMESICQGTGSKEGERTILDVLGPAIRALSENTEKEYAIAFSSAYQAAEDGLESTKAMLPVHGRAAYFGDKALGTPDGGAYAGMLIFQSLYEVAKRHYSSESADV